MLKTRSALGPKTLKEKGRSSSRIPARSNVSAGILAYRRSERGLEVRFSSCIPAAPSGAIKTMAPGPSRRARSTSEDPEQAARRESAEELGPAASIVSLQALGEIRQRGGKRVIAFCGETDFVTSLLASNTFEMEWPPKSGRRQSFPEVDRAEWFNLETARSKMLSGQIELIDRLFEIIV